jgi:hypothetical protein
MCIRKGYDTEKDGEFATNLRQVEKNCGRNCIRKYDKVYKLYDALEPKILSEHCREQGIDEDALVKRTEEDMERNIAGDINAASEMTKNL